MCGFEAFVQDETACNNERENQREKTPSPIVLRVKSYGSGIQSTAEGSLSSQFPHQFPPPLNLIQSVNACRLLCSKAGSLDQTIKGCSPSSSADLKSPVFLSSWLLPSQTKLLLGFFGSCYFYIKYFWEKQMDTLKEKGFLLSSFLWLFMIAHGFLWVILIIDNSEVCAIIESHYEGKR